MRQFAMALCRRIGMLLRGGAQLGGTPDELDDQNARQASAFRPWKESAKLKTMLEYKSHQAGIVFEVVNENYTTQTCSCCGSIPASSPKGRAGLRIREWVCGDCGAVHDRDVNAAKNILAAGHRRLAEGISGV